MSIGLIGKKIGMSRVFIGQGSVPVTIVLVVPNRISQIKNLKTDGYESIQLTAGQKKHVNKPMKGHFLKSGTHAGQVTRESRVELKSLDESYKLSSEIGVGYFNSIKYVDVTGTSKGKGFAGTIKRHGFKGQPNSHGNSKAHRKPGSIGQCQDPGRVFKGKKMAGQMGNVRTTSQNVEVVKIDADHNVLYLKGAIPGAKNGTLIIQQALKKKHNKGDNS